MQTDYREERRWKIVLAFELAFAVLEWHAAGTKEERIRLGICASWMPPEPLEHAASWNMEIDDPQLPGLENAQIDSEVDDGVIMDHDSDAGKELENPEEDDRKDQQDVDDALKPNAIIAEVLDEAQEALSSSDNLPQSISMAPKMEEIDGDDALHLAAPSSPSMDVDKPTSDEGREEPTEALKVEQALKDVSKDPMLDAVPQGDVTNTDTIAKQQKQRQTTFDVKNIKASLLSLPEELLIVSLDELATFKNGDTVPEPDEESANAQTHLDLTLIFPELSTYAMIDVSNSDIVSSSADGKKKSDKKADKDDPSKRVEEATYTKLYPTGIFMNKKPTLIGPLQPAKKWRKGRWINLDESPVVSDVDGAMPAVNEDYTCCEFKHLLSNVTTRSN